MPAASGAADSFAYNTAVIARDETIIHTTYIDRTIVERNTIANNNHVAYNGGPGGIQHTASARGAGCRARAAHGSNQLQTQHIAAARTDKTSFAKANGGHPKTLAVAKPLTMENRAPAPGAKTEARTPQRLHPRRKHGHLRRSRPRPKPGQRQSQGLNTVLPRRLMPRQRLNPVRLLHPGQQHSLNHVLPRHPGQQHSLNTSLNQPQPQPKTQPKPKPEGHEK